MNEFSDHLPLYFELDFAAIQQRSHPRILKYIKWENTKIDAYVRNQQSHKDDILNLVNNINFEPDVHNTVKEIFQIIYNSA